MGKITKVVIKVPKEVTLPDGIYTGIWGDYVIDVRYADKIYELTTEEGVRGMGFRVMVTMKDGVGTYEDIKN